MLQEYFHHVLVKNNVHESHSGKGCLTAIAFKYWPTTTQPRFHYPDSFRIIRGEFPNGKMIQLVVESINQKHPLQTMSMLYASHVMAFLDGSCAAHLYYNKS